MAPQVAHETTELVAFLSENAYAYATTCLSLATNVLATFMIAYKASRPAACTACSWWGTTFAFYHHPTYDENLMQAFATGVERYAVSSNGGAALRLRSGPVHHSWLYHPSRDTSISLSLNC